MLVAPSGTLTTAQDQTRRAERTYVVPVKVLLICSLYIQIVVHTVYGPKCLVKLQLSARFKPRQFQILSWGVYRCVLECQHVEL